MRKRADTARSISTGIYDVCVIGGGASGAGCALDAQLRGLKTVLVDRGDFGCATSTASTKLVHGGLRYLQLAVKDMDIGQYRVVRAALRERALMMRNAPYLTRSRPLAVPCDGFINAWYSRIGVKLYDWLSGSACLAPSYFLNRNRSLKQMPWLNENGLFGAVVYADGQFDDARYDLALVQSFVSAGGDALNYASVDGFEIDKSGALLAARVHDLESAESFKVQAGAFLNATGPFSDRIRRAAAPDLPDRLRQSKGVHILLPLCADWTDEGLLIPETEDGRVIFAIPWMGRLLVGTTESEAGPDDEMAVSRAEAEFLLRHLNNYLARPFQLGDIVATFAGMRPLIRPGDGRDSKRIARDYEIELEPRSGLISVLGGKWTVYRAMAEDAINTVEMRLRSKTGTCHTQYHALFGADRNEAEIKRELLAAYAVDASTIDHLVSKFGSRAVDVLALTRCEPDLLAPIVDGGPYIRAEVIYSARHEMAVNLEDLLRRRLGIELFDWRMALRAAPVAAELLGDELGWSWTRMRNETRLYIERVGRLLQETGCGDQVEESVSYKSTESSES